jgi:HEPN domain-containing protein
MSRLIGMAKAYLRQAESRLEDAEDAFDDRNYPYYDVSEVLLSAKERFPEWFREEVGEMAEASKALASKRGIALYGIEEERLTPDEIVGRDEAESMVAKAKEIHRLCKRLLSLYERRRGRSHEP